MKRLSISCLAVWVGLTLKGDIHLLLRHSAGVVCMAVRHIRLKQVTVHALQELVQVESLAQLGVQLLLFGLGRELSIQKLRSVWGVALLGGSLQILALMFMGGAVSAILRTSVHQGVFIGALLSMSSTTVVIKCLEVTKATNSAYGQITIGTLILQDCSVGLMFAMMPAFGHSTLPGQTSCCSVMIACFIKFCGHTARCTLLIAVIRCLRVFLLPRSCTHEKSLSAAAPLHVLDRMCTLI